MNNRTKKWHCITTGLFLAILCFLVFFAACRTQTQLPNADVNVRIGWQVAWATQGQIAQTLMKTNALNLFNLKGDFKSFTYGAPLSEAALANELDVAFIGDQPAINLISKTPDWEIVGRLMDFRVAIVVPPNSSVKSVADLKGKTLGIPFGASTHRFALQMLKEAGLEPDKDVRILNIDIQEQGEIIRSGKGGIWSNVDAFASWDHHIAAYEREGQARILKSGTAVGVVAMSKRFMNAYPEGAANFLAAFNLAYYYYATHQEKADGWFRDAAQGRIDPSLLNQVAQIEPNLKAQNINSVKIDLQNEYLNLLQAAADFAYQQKLIQSSLDVTKSVNSELSRKADGKINSDLSGQLREQ